VPDSGPDPVIKFFRRIPDYGKNGRIRQKSGPVPVSVSSFGIWHEEDMMSLMNVKPKKNF
jgi:hypothetical protein